MFRRAFSISTVTAFKQLAFNQNQNQIFRHHFHRNMSANGKQIVIGTHSGVFHCDEILACFMLKQLPAYQNAKIIRSRDDAILKDCDIVVDVGGIFDPDTLRFDHHQKTFEHTLGSLRPEYAEKYSTVRLSSAGLVYVHFGIEVIRHVLKQQKNLEFSDECLSKLFEKVYDGFIQEIDGIDNGVPQFAGEPVYQISTHLSARVGQFNSQWNSIEEFNEMEQFEKGMELAGKEFIDKILYYATVWWPARAIVQKAVKNRFNLHPSGKIIELEQFCPWKQHFYDIETSENCEGEILYCIGESGENDWRIICVPMNASSFVCRKFLPSPWRGIRDNDLAGVSGIDDAKFCHATGFIGGAKSRDGVFNMATASVVFDESK